MIKDAKDDLILLFIMDLSSSFSFNTLLFICKIIYQGMSAYYLTSVDLSVELPMTTFTDEL